MKDKKTSTLDDLIETAAHAVVAKEAEDFLAQTGIDVTPGNPNHCEGRTLDECGKCPYYRTVCFRPDGEPAFPNDPYRAALRHAVKDSTGAVLLPGFPEGCQGNGKHADFECCCDGCDHFAACFPEAMPKEDEDMEEERYYTLIRYKCKRCGFKIERRYASPEAHGGGMVTCTCGAFDFDPHPLWPRIGWRNGVDPHMDLEEYFETTPVGKKQED